MAEHRWMHYATTGGTAKKNRMYSATTTKKNINKHRLHYA